MLQANVTEGVHRVEDAYTNWYLIEGDGRLTIVDTGVPTSWTSLLSALRSLGRETGDVGAVVLTHGHFDHLGFAERARCELGVPVWIHENDVPLTRHPLQQVQRLHAVIAGDAIVTLNPYTGRRGAQIVAGAS